MEDNEERLSNSSSNDSFSSSWFADLFLVFFVKLSFALHILGKIYGKTWKRENFTRKLKQWKWLKLEKYKYFVWKCLGPVS